MNFNFQFFKGSKVLESRFGHRKSMNFVADMHENPYRAETWSVVLVVFKQLSSTVSCWKWPQR